MKAYETNLGSHLRGFYQKGNDICRLDYSEGIVEPYVACHSDATGKVISFELYRNQRLEDEGWIVDKDMAVDVSIGRRKRQVERGSHEALDIQEVHDNSTKKTIAPGNYAGNSAFWPGDSGIVIR